MRKFEIVLKEYASKLSTENLQYLYVRFHNRVNSDIYEIMDYMLKNPEIDKWFATAKSSDELFSLLDNSQEYIDREYSRRVPEIII